MTTFYEETSSTQNDRVEKQIQLLQHVVQENRRKLEDISKKKKKADEDIKKCKKEMDERVNLLSEHGDIVDALQSLGKLLEQQHCLKEQLNSQSEEDRRLWKNLQDRKQSITIKTESLTREIEHVTRQLEEARAHYKSAQSSRPETGSKSKRNRTKQR